MEKFIQLGEKLGLEGEKLLEFVREQEQKEEKHRQLEEEKEEKCRKNKEERRKTQKRGRGKRNTTTTTRIEEIRTGSWHHETEGSCLGC